MFSGVFVAIVTPFKDGAIDEASLKRHINWLLENNIDGIVPCGTTGEASTLSQAEHSRVVKIAVQEVRDRCPVIAGAGTNSTAKSIELAKLVQEAGATATLTVTPYYNKPMQEGLYQHFKAIASAVKIPHILYNVPGRTSVNMLPETVERLAKIDNIVGIKEASGNLEQIAEIRKRTPRNFMILSGNDDQNLDIYKLGGNGAISVTANIVPDRVASIWNAFSSNNTEGAGMLQQKLQDLNKAMFIETNPIPVKTALSVMKRLNDEFRLPLTTIASANRECLIQILRHYNLV